MYKKIVEIVPFTEYYPTIGMMDKKTKEILQLYCSVNTK